MEDSSTNPNFAIICSFIDIYGSKLNLPIITFAALQLYLEETRYVPDKLREIIIFLLKKWKMHIKEENWQNYLIKFCAIHSVDVKDELEVDGFSKCKFSTKLTIIKNLLEQQFDTNIKFKEMIKSTKIEEMRFLPIGRDKNGFSYWHIMDKEFNLSVYKESCDDPNEWSRVVSDRDSLAVLINYLEGNEIVTKKELTINSDDNDKSDADIKLEKESNPDEIKLEKSDELTSNNIKSEIQIKQEIEDNVHEKPVENNSNVLIEENIKFKTENGIEKIDEPIKTEVHENNVDINPVALTNGELSKQCSQDGSVDDTTENPNKVINDLQSEHEKTNEKPAEKNNEICDEIEEKSDTEHAVNEIAEKKATDDEETKKTDDDEDHNEKDDNAENKDNTNTSIILKVNLKSIKNLDSRKRSSKDLNDESSTLSSSSMASDSQPLAKRQRQRNIIKSKKKSTPKRISPKKKEDTSDKNNGHTSDKDLALSLFTPRRSSRANKGIRKIDNTFGLNTPVHQVIELSASGNESTENQKSPKKKKNEKKILEHRQILNSKKKNGKKRGRTALSDNDKYTDDEEEYIFDTEKVEEFGTWERAVTPSLLESDEDNKEHYTPVGKNALRCLNKSLISGDCYICSKSNHPELILLCDQCDKGVHTMCATPILMLIPEGDWYCSDCEQKRLITELCLRLEKLDQFLLKNERLSRRKERLAFLDISLDNILPSETKIVTEKLTEQYSASNSDEEIMEMRQKEYADRRRRLRREARQRTHRPIRSKRLQDKWVSESSEVSEDEIQYRTIRQTRTCRSKLVNYKFEEYDEAMKTAISLDAEAVQATNNVVDDDSHKFYNGPGAGKGINTEIPNLENDDPTIEDGVKKGIGKDIYNCHDSNEEETVENRPKEKSSSESEIKNDKPPAVVIKIKKSKKIFGSEDEEPDSGEEYKISGSGSENAEEAIEEYSSEEYKITKRKKVSKRKPRRNYSDSEDEDVYSSEEDEDFLPVRRAVIKNKISYKDESSSDESDRFIAKRKGKKRFSSSENASNASEEEEEEEEEEDDDDNSAEEKNMKFADSSSS